MRQRREDARNIALIVGSGALGVVATLVGVTLMGSSMEVHRHPGRTWESHSVQSMERAQAEMEARQKAMQAQREALELSHLAARLEELQAQWEATEWSRGSRELAAQLEELQARLEAARAQMEAMELSRAGREAEGTSSVEAQASGDAPQAAVYVDGIRLDGGIEDLEPQDIERVEVLKGTEAVKQYGKTGENGVIIVTTKGGKKRKGGGRR